jgi:hypothetical protein
MSNDIPGEISLLAQHQAGAISRQQLLEAGLNPQLIIRRLERGRWQQLYRGIYAVFTGLPPRETWLWAAVLRAGEGAVLSHQTAAELHGLINYPADAIYLTIPSTRRVAARGMIVRISRRVEQSRQPNRSPPRTSVEETVLDLVQVSPSLDDACGWITKACAKRLTTEDKLRAALAMRKKMRWRTELDNVLEAAGSGIHSVLEYRYLRDVEHAHGLPRSRHQVRVVIDGKTVYRDAYYEEYQAAVELDGQLAHPDDERWRDSHRDNQAYARGVQTSRYGWRDVYAHPCETAVLQARILQRRGWKGTPRPCSPRCPVGRAFSQKRGAWDAVRPPAAVLSGTSYRRAHDPNPRYWACGSRSGPGGSTTTSAPTPWPRLAAARSPPVPPCSATTERTWPRRCRPSARQETP